MMMNEDEAMAHPMYESSESARILKLLRPLASTSCVCPPETSRVRNGNVGGTDSVRSGVRACACYDKEQDQWTIRNTRRTWLTM